MTWQETWIWTVQFFFGSFRHFVALTIWTLSIMSVWHINFHNNKKKDDE